MGPHAQEAADRQNDVWLLAVTCHKEIINLADRFVRIVEDVAADDLGRPIAPATFCTSTLAIFACAANKPTPIIEALTSNIG